MFEAEFQTELERLRSRSAESPSRGVLEAVLILVAARPHDLAAIFEASPESLVAFDAHRRILHANAGAERLFGYERGALEGVLTDALLPERLRQPQAPPMVAVSDVMQVDLPGQRRDGTEFAVEWAFGSVSAPKGALFVMTVRDRAAMDRAIETLRASDLERRLSVERMAREAAEAAEKRVRSSEARLRRLQRVTAALSEAATPADVAAVVLDQCLQALEANGGAVYALSADGGALELIDQRGHPAEPLAPYERIPLGLRSPLTDAARERTPGFFESFDACAELYPHLREAIRSGGFEASVALPLLTHGATLGVLGIRFLTPRVFDPSDRSLLLTLGELCAQALERARLLAAERDARAEAEAANRSKDEFLAMLGHELRNPLAPIVTALSLMELRDVGRAVQNERTVIERQVAHLVRLVDDLLDVSRITQEKVELKKERIQLASVVARAVELSSPLLEQRRHRLSVSVPDEGLAVYGDATRLSQVVSNLLTNAAKYTPPDGHIEITASHTQARIVLTVRDDGIGIAPAMLPRVFELFAQERQSLERSQGGLGLGLAIVKSLVTMHDGTVSAFSEGHGKGSVFRIEIPAAGPEAGRSAEARPLTVRAAPEKSLRVLVVDDNADAADLLAEALGASGHVTSVAQDGPTALHIADTFRPDIALLDIGLPVMDGYELAGKLRSQLGAVRLIAVTGYGQTPDRERARAAGFDVHLIKPVDLDALLAAVG
jgi:PAS domain S-box-containing protein